jgi:hypothetical protein
MRNNSYENCSRSSSYIASPSTPGVTLYGNPIEEEDFQKDKPEGIDEVTDAVIDLTVA